MEHDYVTVTLCIVVALRMYRHFTPIEHLAPDTPPPENYRHEGYVYSPRTKPYP